jgi:hypothetical protein
LKLNFSREEQGRSVWESPFHLQIASSPLRNVGLEMKLQQKLKVGQRQRKGEVDGSI